MATFSLRAMPAFAGLMAMVAVFVGPRPALSNEVETLPADAGRIVSVGGSITEIVYALGEEKRLVARDQTSLFPSEALALPDVGYMRALSPEGVLSVDPDGVLMLEGSGPPQALDVLKKASVPLVMIPDRYDGQGIVDKIRAVGAAMGAKHKAEDFAGKVSADLEDAARLTAGIEDRKRVLFILSLQGGKIMASGAHTAANGIIRMAGAVNAIEGFDGYRPLNDEAIISAQPDVVMMMSRGDGSEIPDAEIFAHPAIAATPAGRDRRIVRMDGLYLLGFGPRTAEAVRDLARSLYGDGVSN